MVMRQPSSILSLLRPILKPSYICSSCRRSLHNASNRPPRPIPSPTPFVPDVPTFLTLIGRQLKTHAPKISSWDELFTLSSQQLKARGLEPPRTRKYLLRWREKFRRGDYGIGGDLKFVDENGVAELRVCEVPARSRPAKTATTTAAAKGVEGEGSTKPFASTSHTPGTAKVILNVPAGGTSYEAALAKGETSATLSKPKGMKLREGHIIAGSYVIPAKGEQGSVATIRVTEGMWEDVRGKKVHGGERRRAEVLHKLAVEKHRKETR